MRSLLLLITLLFVACSSGENSLTPTDPNLDNTPIIIAHRGLSGELPEHTIAAYKAAIEAGADFIEPDLVLTKDGVLVARHENEISDTTNVESIDKFAARKATKVIDEREVTGWFTEDFTLEELKTLRAKERLGQLRDKTNDGRFEIPTFEEILALLEKVNEDRDVPIGVYPETKHPSYFSSIDLSHEKPLLELLERFGYKGKKAPVFIQSFEVANLKALREKTDLPIIQLMASQGGPPGQGDVTYADMATPDGLEAISAYADGIGPDKNMIIPRNMVGKLKSPTSLVSDAHDAGLKVHPWTFRRENYFLPLEYKSGVDPRKTGDLASEIEAFLATGIDGIFTDNTPEAVDVLHGQR